METSNNNSATQIILFWSVPSISQIKEYKRNCDLLKDANSQLKSVKVITNKNQTEKFKSIEIESDTFYGLKKIKGELKRFILNVNSIKSVMLL